MKLPELTKTLAALTAMQDEINGRIDDLDQDSARYEEKDEFLNDAYMEVDEAIEALTRVAEMKQSDYF